MKRPFSAPQLSVHDHHLGKFNTFTGVEIDLLHPDEQDINIIDIAHALSNICRFGGHSNYFFSVAQHCVVVAALAPEPLKLAALLHDAPEAYLGDVIKPLKHLIGHHYTQFEALFELVIGKRFGFDHHQLKAIKEYDRLALEIENEAVKHSDPTRLLDVLAGDSPFVRSWGWHPHVPGWAWHQVDAEREFLEKFTWLCKTEKEAAQPVLTHR